MFFSKKRWVAVAAIVLAAGAAQAQGPGMGGQRPTAQQLKQMRDKQKAQAYKELGVTPTQKTKLDAIENKYMPQLLALQKKYMAKIQTNVAAMKKKYPKQEQQQQAMQEMQPMMMKVQQQAMAEVKPVADKMERESMAVLTPAQRAKYKKMQAARRGPAGRP